MTPQLPVTNAAPWNHTVLGISTTMQQYTRLHMTAQQCTSSSQAHMKTTCT